MKARRDFIKAFVASAGAMTFSGVATANTDIIAPIVTLILNEDPQFVLLAGSSATAIVATPFLLSQASFVTDTVFLARPTM